VEVEAGEITKYNGNIDDYFEQKQLLRAQLAAEAANQAEKRKAILDFVNRFGAKATKAKQAQSKMKRLEKMEEIEFKPAPVSAVIQIPQSTHVGRSVLTLERACFGYGDRAVIQNVNFEIQRGDHVAVVGLNGAGKSTLLKGLAGTLAPLTGERKLGYQAEIAIFNQHVVEVLEPEDTVIESLQSAASSAVLPQEVRNMAGSLLFSSDQIHKKIKVLSGGEKSRVALGRILLKKVPCLLLDEPTNHLDFQTVEALTQALNRFTGTLVVVSHDRGFIRRVATKIMEVSDGRVHLYPGTYDEYVWSLQKSLAAESETETAPKKWKKASVNRRAL
jgi:ATP-binding cassette subfamily F protein 3